MSVFRRGSYGDALRLFNQAIDEMEKITKEEKWESRARNALSLILKALLLLSGKKLPPDIDLTNLAAMALDAEIITDEEFAEIVEVNLALNGFGELSINKFTLIFRKLLRGAEKIDPYLSQQMTLFRY